MKLVLTIFLSFIAVGSLTISNAQKKKGAGKDTVIEKIKAAVESGEITREEAKQLIETNSIGPFQDFKSKKTGNPFAASLYLKKNQSIGYRFAKKE